MLNRMTDIKSEIRSFKSNENIHKKEGRSYYVVEFKETLVFGYKVA